MKAVIPIIEITKLDMDAWVASLSNEQKDKLSRLFGLDAYVLTVENTNGASLGSLTRNIAWDLKDERESFIHEQRFEPPLFFTLYPDFPKARLDGLTANIRLHIHETEHRIHQPLTHILRSVTGDQSYFVSVEDSGRLVVKHAEGLPPPEKPRPPSSW